MISSAGAPPHGLHDHHASYQNQLVGGHQPASNHHRNHTEPGGQPAGQHMQFAEYGQQAMKGPTMDQMMMSHHQAAANHADDNK